jgi:hypothetical protein
LKSTPDGALSTTTDPESVVASIANPLCNPIRILTLDEPVETSRARRPPRSDAPLRVFVQRPSHTLQLNSAGAGFHVTSPVPASTASTAPLCTTRVPRNDRPGDALLPLPRSARRHTVHVTAPIPW